MSRLQQAAERQQAAMRAAAAAQAQQQQPQTPQQHYQQEHVQQHHHLHPHHVHPHGGGSAAAPSSSVHSGGGGGKSKGSKRKSPARDADATTVHAAHGGKKQKGAAAAGGGGGAGFAAPVAVAASGTAAAAAVPGPSKKDKKLLAALEMPDAPLTGSYRVHGPGGVSQKLRRIKGAMGALPLPGLPPPPPLATSFLNISQGFRDMQHAADTHVFPWGRGGAPAATVAPAATAAGSTASPMQVDTLKASSGSSEDGGSSMPVAARWFDFNTVHDIERRAFPELFSEGCHPRLAQRYQSARNFLVRHFRSQVPRRYVSLTETLRLVTGDAQLLTRIHSLLDAWGIINHLVDPGVGPIAMVAGSSNSSYPLLAQSAYEQLQQAPMAPTALAAAKAAAAAPVAASAHAAQPNRPMDALQQLILDCSGTSAATSLSTRRSVLLGPSQAASTEPLVAEYAARRNPAQSLQCSVCASSSVESVRYVCRQRRDYICCSACFLGGRYAPLLSSADFERLLSAVSDEEQQAPVQPEAAAATTAAGGEWGREEVLRLLQGVALHEQDWEAVAEHVGSRSKDECVLKFLQMPIEEPFLEQWFNTLAPEAGLPSAKDQAAARIATAAASSSAAATSAATKTIALPSSASSAAAAGTSSSTASTTTTVLAHNIPFRDAPNPLLSQVSFLSTYVSPSVGAAAAQAVLSYMSVRDMDGVPVHTPFGPGRIVVAPPAIPAAAADGNMTVSSAFAHTSFTRADGIVTVALPWGRLYAHASSLSVDKEAHRALERAKQRATATAAASSNKAAPEPIWQRELVPLTHHLLQAAARKAVELAEEEERKVLRYVAQITGLLMKRVELKLAHLGELDEWSATQAVAYDAGAIKNHNERNAAIAAAQAAAAAAALAASPSPSPPHPQQQHQPQPSPPMPSPQRPQVF